MVLVGERAVGRNAAETFGLERELMGRWENSTTRGGPVRLVKGQVLIIDDTVDHKEYSRGTCTPENYWIYCHTHGRFERAKLLTVAIVNLGRTFMVGTFPYAVRKMLNL